jgi:hypothetical protein
MARVGKESGLGIVRISAYCISFPLGTTSAKKKEKESRVKKQRKREEQKRKLNVGPLGRHHS